MGSNRNTVVTGIIYVGYRCTEGFPDGKACRPGTHSKAAAKGGPAWPLRNTERMLWSLEMGEKGLVVNPQ